MKYRVEDRPNLIRDGHSKAIVNEDVDAYKRYLSERTHRKNLSDTNRALESQIHNLKSEIDELKSLVEKLVRDR